MKAPTTSHILVGFSLPSGPPCPHPPIQSGVSRRGTTTAGTGGGMSSTLRSRSTDGPIRHPAQQYGPTGRLPIHQWRLATRSLFRRRPQPEATAGRREADDHVDDAARQGRGGAAVAPPVKQIKQHVCTFALYAHDPHRQVETHHFVSRLNQDVLQCPVYDSDDKHARLIGVEYIVSRKIFESLPAEEQKLWHSHAHEIETGLWANPWVPSMLGKAELDHMAGTFGKFWCTWQVDRGDRLPLGAPALMVSPQAERVGAVRPDLVRKRDQKYSFSTEELKAARADVEVPAEPRPGQADYWVRHHKGFAVDVVPHEMKRHAPFP
ncbi:hypothetical protein ZWY2020_004984 [Hordeum vulgare]|nr:hypothetical protein ZWY2020_004984 [Hordeum vulgare]